MMNFNDKVDQLMEAAQCLNEAFHDLADNHPLVKYREVHGIALTRSRINECAVMCEETYKIMLEEYEYDKNYDWDFCPDFLEFCVNHKTFQPKSDDPRHLIGDLMMGEPDDGE